MIEFVTASDWRIAAERLHADGCEWFGLLTAVDDPKVGTLDVVLVVAGPESSSWQGIRVQLDRLAPSVATVSDLWRGAVTAERETAEMFGVVFEGHPDPRPYLLPPGTPPVLRRDLGLSRRAETRWPGEKEPGDATVTRRRRSRALAADPDAWDGAV